MQCRRPEFDPWVGKIPWRRKWLLTLVFLPGESHGQSNLMGYSPWGCKELDTTEQLTHTAARLLRDYSTHHETQVQKNLMTWINQLVSK